MQTIGGAFIVYGAHLMFGTGIAAIVGGVLLVIAGMLGEASDNERRAEAEQQGEGDGPGPTD